MNFKNSILFIPLYPKCYQHNSVENCSEMSYIFFSMLGLQNLVCILQLQHNSIQTSHISVAQKPHVTSGYYIRQLVATGFH